jgi:hypothetical protein
MPDHDRFEHIRQEITQLLQAQLEALADLSELTDAQLSACYWRHERVRELRDQLSVSGAWRPEDATLSQQSSAPLAGNTEAAAAVL